MSHYSEYSLRALLSTPIVGILAALGKRTDRPASKGFYFSPLREESNPSFQINETSNVWKDWGTGESGGVLDLVCRIKGCSRGEAVDFLAGMNPHLQYSTATDIQVRQQNASSITIDSVGPVKTPFLISYAKSRKIKTSILQTFCEEVVFHIGDSSKTYRSIGFRNNSGGYVLRNAMMGNLAKLCTRPSDITTFDSLLTRTPVPFSDRVIVVEGFMDFLSLVILGLNKGADVCVLNSGTNVRRAVPYIVAHAHAELLLDRDRAGDSYTRQIKDLCSSIECTDCRHMIGSNNDLNDLLLGHPGVRKPSCHRKSQDTITNNVKQKQNHL